MAKYKNNYRSNQKGNRKRKYSKAEQIAFELGQRNRILDNLKNGDKNSLVYDAYCKGLYGNSVSVKKPLFGK